MCLLSEQFEEEVGDDHQQLGNGRQNGRNTVNEPHGLFSKCFVVLERYLVGKKLAEDDDGCDEAYSSSPVVKRQPGSE